MILAQADFCKPGSDKIKGFIAFSQYDPNFVRVDIELTDVPIGVHGIHVHEHSINFNIDKDFCLQAKSHFNGLDKLWSPKTPNGTPHGSFILKTDRHIGDMCNNIISINGIVKMTYYDNLINLIPGHPHCILGRSVVIHNEEDDGGLYIPKKNSKKEENKIIESMITGNAGKRIGCANIILLTSFRDGH